MSKRTLNILAPTRYPWTFNGPRKSRHNIDRRNFVPFNKISSKIEGVTIFNPLPPKKFDLIHAFNRIPIGTTPYIIGLESHLPRAFGLENSYYFEALSKSLASDRCRGIFPISEYAKRHFVRQHQGKPWLEALMAKTEVHYPNVPIPDMRDGFDGDIHQLKLVFVGNHFVRKGGLAVIKLAGLAQQAGIDLNIDIISSLEMGASSWVDPLNEEYLEKCIRNPLTSAGNIKVHGALPNSEVIRILRESHFSLLPTFSDTFGFSAIESMANYVPVIATSQGALPEFIENGENGFLLHLDVDEVGEWSHIGRNDRAAKGYAELFEAESDRLAAEMLGVIEKCLSSPDLYKVLRKNCRQKTQDIFSEQGANLFWDETYERCVV